MSPTETGLVKSSCWEKNIFFGLQKVSVGKNK